MFFFLLYAFYGLLQVRISYKFAVQLLFVDGGFLCACTKFQNRKMHIT